MPFFNPGQNDSPAEHCIIIVASEINTIIIMVTDVRWLEISSIIVEHDLL